MSILLLFLFFDRLYLVTRQLSEEGLEKSSLKELISSFLMPKTGAGRECDLLECEKEELKAQPLLSCFENLNS